MSLTLTALIVIEKEGGGVWGVEERERGVKNLLLHKGGIIRVGEGGGGLKRGLFSTS